MKRNLLQIGFLTIVFAVTILICSLVEVPAQKINPRTDSQTMTKNADNSWLQAQLREIEKNRQQLEKYDPMVKGYLVGYSPIDYILLAVSPRARTAWLKSENALDVRKEPNNKLDAALDALAAVAAAKLPVYRMNLGLYTIRDDAAEELMKNALKNLSTLEIHFIGLKDSSKAGAVVPLINQKRADDRPQYGVIWTRDRADDHPYCHLYHFSFAQDETEMDDKNRPKLFRDELVGCPVTPK